MKSAVRPRTVYTRWVLRSTFAAGLLVSLFPAPGTGSETRANKRALARAQFARAEEQREELQSKPAAQRTLEDYKRAVSAFRRVYLITPHSAEVPQALAAVAELNAEMGEKFGRKYFQSAVDSYQFLLHEYPATRYREEALLSIARIQKDDLGDGGLAAKSYEEFLKRYPRSRRRREAEEALAELALLRKSPAKESAAKTGSKETEVVEADQTGDSSRVPRVRKITTSGGEDSTRIVIELEGKVNYQSARIANPDRIFFDLHKARLSPQLAGGTIEVNDRLVRSIRVAQNQEGVVRVVLDVSEVHGYTASLLDHPARLVVEMHGNGATTARALPQRDPPPGPKPAATPAKEPPARAGKAAVRNASRKKPEEEPAEKTRVVAEASSRPEANPAGPASAAKSPRAHNTRTARDAAEPIAPPGVPQPTRNGQQSLTRALGLKIGRIVIDPGHGGHDTGTIGPTGLMEKDLCLDVALRLGKIIERRLPGAEVVFTREDDAFVSLEDRTAIANQAKADLFLSIHANSSSDPKARGVETYYLNLHGSPEAMEVAARENTTAQGGVHDLQDLVKKIARNEKIEESHEFAVDVQNSLSARIQKTARIVKNRGVRKAPFVVLIGANMPSVLAEISFLSNPADEQLLKRPDHRQRVAEGLYQGVASYLQSLNSLTYNLPHRNPGGRSPAVEHSGNQR